MRVKDLKAWLDAAAGSGLEEVTVGVMGERGTRRIVSLGLCQGQPQMVVASDVTPFGLPPSVLVGDPSREPWKCDECLQVENTGPMCINCGGPPPPRRVREKKPSGSTVYSRRQARRRRGLPEGCDW